MNMLNLNFSQPVKQVRMLSLISNGSISSNIKANTIPSTHIGWWKLPLSILCGLCVSVVLFGVMKELVSPPNDIADQKPQANLIDFVRVKRDESLQQKKREIPKKPPPKKPPPPPEMKVAKSPSKPKTPKMDIKLPKMEMEMDLSLSGELKGFSKGVSSASSSGPTPLNQLDPRYPRKALRSGATGSVEFKFTVSPTGSVTNIVIIREKPRGKGFAQAVKQAATKWRFKPATENDQAIPWTMQVTYEFVLE